jgi:hypothetical protein
MTHTHTQIIKRKKVDDMDGVCEDAMTNASTTIQYNTISIDRLIERIKLEDK